MMYSVKGNETNGERTMAQMIFGNYAGDNKKAPAVTHMKGDSYSQTACGRKNNGKIEVTSSEQMVTCKKCLKKMS
jgi:hypothetical protein